MLILRDAGFGMTRFDQFRTSLGIAPNILARRLHKLTQAGLLTKTKYSERPPRDEYLLTEAGRDFSTCFKSSEPGAVVTMAAAL
jgi:DNA-binding HxlR family transcriptional regulator